MSVGCQEDPLWRVPPPVAGQDGIFSPLFNDLDLQSIPPPIDESEAVPDYGSCCEVATAHVPPVPHELEYDGTGCFIQSVSDVLIAGTDVNIPVQPAAPQVSAGRGQRLTLREKNRLKQANYREKLKRQRAYLEGSVTAVTAELEQQKARKARLRAQYATLFTRLKIATCALGNVLSGRDTTQLPPSGSCHTASSHRSLEHRIAGNPTVPPTNPSHKACAASPESEPASGTKLCCRQSGTQQIWVGQSHYTDTPPLPRPIHSYLHMASISHADVLPHMPPTESSPLSQQQATRRNLNFAGHDARTAVPCSEHTLLQVSVDYFVHSTTASKMYSPSETCWFIQFPYELQRNLCLSHSATLASTSCHLSTTLIFWLISIEHAFIFHMEDPDIASQEDPAKSQTMLEEWQAQKLSYSASPADADIMPVNLQLPTIPKDPPPLEAFAPEYHLVTSNLQYCLTCGEGQRWPVGDAVARTVPSMLQKYRKQLPYGSWRRVCMQALHAMHGQLACIQQRKEDGSVHSHDSQKAEAAPEIGASTGVDGGRCANSGGTDAEACCECTSHGASGVATSAKDTKVSGDASSNPSIPSGQGARRAGSNSNPNSNQHTSKLKQNPRVQGMELRPCMPGMCGAHGICNDAPTEGQSGDAIECSWCILPQVVTATLHAVYHQMRLQVVSADGTASDCGAGGNKNGKQSSKKACNQHSKSKGAVDLPEHKEVVQQYGAEDTSQRSRDLNVSVAVCACMVMRQSRAIYRRIFQPCPVVVAYAERRVMRVYQYLRLTRSQKQQFATLWWGWQRHRRSLDRPFCAALARLAGLPSAPHVVPNACGSCTHHTSHACTENDTAPAHSHESCSTVSPQHTETVGADLQALRVCQTDSRKDTGGLNEDKGELKKSRQKVYECYESQPARKSDQNSPEYVTCGSCGSHVNINGSQTVVPDSSKRDTKGSNSRETWTQTASTQSASTSDSCGGVNSGCELLGTILVGANGAAMAEAHAAIQDLRDAHDADERSQEQFTAMVALPAWALSQVEVRRFWSALLECQVPTVDVLMLMRTAAHELSYEALFVSTKHFNL